LALGADLWEALLLAMQAGKFLWVSAWLTELPFRALCNSGVRPEKLHLSTSSCCKTPKSEGPACSGRVAMLGR